MDRQLKLHGYRIEPAEVEEAMLTIREIAAAAVVSGGDRLVAYLVADDASQLPSAQQLQEQLRLLLPFPMIPQVYVALAELPLTPAGKADLLALPALSAHDRAVGQPHAGDTDIRTAQERLAADLICESLEVEDVGLDDDFFLLGGNSLQAMRFAARLGAITGRKMPVTVLFENSTARRVAEYLDSMESS